MNARAVLCRRGRGRPPRSLPPGASPVVLLLLLTAFVAGAADGGLCAQAPAAARPDWDPAAETLVVYNTAFEGSEALAREYAIARGIPRDRLLGLSCSTEETISRETFESTLREPLLRHLIKQKWWLVEKRDLVDPQSGRRVRIPQVVKQKIKVLVLMRGMPVRVSRVPAATQPGPQELDEASVDSEFAALGLLQRPIKGPLANRYYLSTLRFADCHEASGQILVGRLDAADDATVRRMIADSLRAEKEGLWGRAVVDFSLMEGGYDEGEQWLHQCVKLYRDAGIPVVTDRSPAVFRDAWPLPDTMLYFGWYTDKCRGAFAAPSFRFKPGAIACHLHSYSASILRSKTDCWVGPLLDKGAAAALGNVWEPYLTLTVHFDAFNARLLSGATFGEAAWASMPGLSWMNVVVGDPLYRPFPRNRPVRGKDPRDQDYALYAGLVSCHLPHDGKKFRRELLRLAEERRSPHLLELMALLSAEEGNAREAGDFLQHARALFSSPEDQLRCALYESEIVHRKGDAKATLELVNRILSEKRFNSVPALSAALGFQKDLGG